MHCLHVKGLPAVWRWIEIAIFVTATTASYYSNYIYLFCVQEMLCLFSQMNSELICLGNVDVPKSLLNDLLPVAYFPLELSFSNWTWCSNRIPHESLIIRAEDENLDCQFQFMSDTLSISIVHLFSRVRKIVARKHILKIMVSVLINRGRVSWQCIIHVDFTYICM